MTHAQPPLQSTAAGWRWSIATVTSTLAAATVQAAPLSKGRITVFAKDKSYDNLMICIKDWITQVNSGHRDRFAQPKNVQVGKPS